jgi:hypothetical protein
MSGAGPFGGAPGMGFTGGGPGLEALAGLYRAFVESLRAASGSAVGDRGREFEAFGARFFGAPSPFGAAPAFDATSAAPAPHVVPALGPTREHQRRLECLRVAIVRLAAAQQAQGALLAAAGAQAGAQFLGDLAARDLAGDGLRATFDRWIEHAEAAWQQLAHSAEWCEAQARTFDAALELRAAQQAIADDAARLAGLPTLRDVDALHRRLRDVESAARPTKKPSAPKRPTKAKSAAARPAPRRKPRP